MKLFKLLAILFISVSVVSCGGDDSPSFDLSTANLVGTYNLTEFDRESISNATINGVEIEVTNKTYEGIDFDKAELSFSANSYTLDGAFTIDTFTETLGIEGIVEGFEIKNFEEESTFLLNILNETITFNGDDELINGTYIIKTFNSRNLVLTQEKIVDIEDTDTIDTVNSTLTFEKQ